MIEAPVIGLQILPLKGGASMQLEEARMTRAGLETVEGNIQDHFLVAVTKAQDAEGFHNFFTQRRQVDPSKNLFVPGTPQLALARPESRDGRLVLNFNGKSEVTDPGMHNDDPSKLIPVQVWEHRGNAIEVPILSEWLSDNLQRDVRVARTSGNWNRMARQNFQENNNGLRSQDGYPVHAVAWEDAVRIFGAIGADVDPSRFRYQVLLDGLPFRGIHDYEFAEVNGVRVDQPKPCDRCEVTGIDQKTGEFSNIKPLAGVSKLSGRWIRPDSGAKVHIVGENWLPQGETIIRTGDIVTFMDLRTIPLNIESRIKT